MLLWQGQGGGAGRGAASPCLPGLLHRAPVRIAQKHLPQDAGAQEVHKVDQGSGHLRARLQVREEPQGLPQAALGP